MLKGFFKYGFPMIGLVVEGKGLDFLLDTGFNGHLMLPKKIIEKMELKEIGYSDYSTASGGNIKTEIFKASINFFGEETEVSVLATDAEFSLAGIELFSNCKIVIEKHSEIVEITKTNVSFTD